MPKKQHNSITKDEQAEPEIPPSQLIITFAGPGSTAYRVQIVGSVAPAQVLGAALALAAEARTTIETNVEIRTRQQLMEEAAQRAANRIMTAGGPLPRAG